MTESPRQTITAWVTFDKQTVYPGNFLVPRDVVSLRVWRETAFDSDGDDFLDIGYVGDPDAYANNIDLAGTKLATVTLINDGGFDATPRELVLTYSNGGSEPTAGAALVEIGFVIVPRLI